MSITTTKRTVTINQPVEKVFAFIAHSPNLVAVWPSLLASNKFTIDEEGLGHHDTTYMMAGVRINVVTHETVRILNKKIVSVADEGIKNTLTWDFIDNSDGTTTIDFQADYEAPGKVFGGITTEIVKRLNEVDLDLFIAKLKRTLDAMA